MARHGLTNEQWALISELMPKPAKTGRPRSDDRLMFNAVLWILRTGAPWRDLPGEFGPWITAYVRFRDWRASGLWDRIVERLLGHLNAQGVLDTDLWCIDGSVIRASRAAGGAAKGGHRKSRKTMRSAGRGAGSARSFT